MSDTSEGVTTFCTWTNDETEAAIQLWGDADMQRRLRGKIRNRSVYQRLSEQMSARGYRRTWLQCREKLKKLRLEYQKLHQSGTAHDKSNFRFYEHFDAVLGQLPAAFVHSLPAPEVQQGLDMSIKSEYKPVPTMFVDERVVVSSKKSAPTSLEAMPLDGAAGCGSFSTTSCSGYLHRVMDTFMEHVLTQDKKHMELELQWRREDETRFRRAEQADRMMLQKMDSVFQLLAPSSKQLLARIGKSNND